MTLERGFRPRPNRDTVRAKRKEKPSTHKSYTHKQYRIFRSDNADPPINHMMKRRSSTFGRVQGLVSGLLFGAMASGCGESFSLEVIRTDGLVVTDDGTCFQQDIVQTECFLQEVLVEECFEEQTLIEVCELGFFGFEVCFEELIIEEVCDLVVIDVVEVCQDVVIDSVLICE